MAAQHPIAKREEESDGEEEIVASWKATTSDNVVAPPSDDSSSVSQSSIDTPVATEQSSVRIVSPDQDVNGTYNKISQLSNQPIPAPILPNASFARVTATSLSTPTPNPVSPVPTADCTKSAWYLGGNHVVKLLTSVDGDFDEQVLSSLATVPAVIGELALSVESLVSDDYTQGDFERDVLAKIVENTLEARRVAMTSHHQQQAPPQASNVVVVNQQPQPPHSTFTVADPTGSNTASPSVPNPLSSYKPVPNPLARITPPGSPLTVSSKRKESPDELESPRTKKMMRRVEMPEPAINVK